MRILAGILAALPAVQSVNIVLSNDDGWAEANIRQFYTALTHAGHSVVLSAPAQDKSGTGMFLSLSSIDIQGHSISLQLRLHRRASSTPVLRGALLLGRTPRIHILTMSIRKKPLTRRSDIAGIQQRQCDMA
jgi:hypothetical protein